MLRKRLALFVDYSSRLAILENFLIPVVRSINEPTHHRPLASFPVIVVAFYQLADNLPITVAVL
jgi:hypothetical protein